MSFGKEVRRRRKALKLTLDQLAERAGLTPNYIGTVENGHRDPSLSTIVALARGLGVAPGELLGGIADLSARAIEAAQLLEEMQPEVQNALIDLIYAVHKKKR